MGQPGPQSCCSSHSEGGLADLGSPGPQLMFGIHCSTGLILAPQATACLCSGGSQALAGFGGGCSGPAGEYGWDSSS